MKSRVSPPVGIFAAACLDESMPLCWPSALTSRTSAATQTCFCRPRSMDWRLETPEALPAARRLYSHINHTTSMTLRGCLYASNHRQSETSEFGCCLIDSHLEISIGDWLNICRDSDRTPAAMVSNSLGCP